MPEKYIISFCNRPNSHSKLRRPDKQDAWRVLDLHLTETTVTTLLALGALELVPEDLPVGELGRQKRALDARTLLEFQDCVVLLLWLSGCAAEAPATMR